MGGQQQPSQRIAEAPEPFRTAPPVRHTAATWLMQAGVAMWEAAGWLGMTVEQLEANYSHHHPDFQEEVAVAFGGRRWGSSIFCALFAPGGRPK